jgi:hypothetical protein
LGTFYSQIDIHGLCGFGSDGEYARFVTFSGDTQDAVFQI